MGKLEEILSKDKSIDNVIKELKAKSVYVPSWADLIKDYEPKLHKIVNDHIGRKDKNVDGHTEEASRIYVGLEKLLSKRVNEFTFGIPVKRCYHNIEDNPTRKEIAKCIEAIYKNARIDAENIKRGLAYYASCEIFTIWYVTKSPNTLYGFPCEFKLKCKTYSPMDGVRLYPLFDELGDMLAMSLEYTTKVEDKDVTFFECYTATKHYKWRSDKGTEWEETGEEMIAIEKIPGVYLYRDKPVYDGLSVLREELEYTLSRTSDIIAYNAAPVLMIAGQLQGTEEKGEGRRRYRVENGGNVSYVSWNQSIEATKYHVENLIDLFFMQGQMPNISFEKMVGLGSIGYDARQTIFMDSHLKIGEESGPWIECFDRESNVIKAFVKKIRTDWANEVDNVSVESIITPFNQNDERSVIENAVKANGGKAVISQRESIAYAGLTENVDETLRLIQEEEKAESELKMKEYESATNISAI